MDSKYFYDPSQHKQPSGFEIVDASLLRSDTLEKVKQDIQKFSNPSSREYGLDAITDIIRSGYDGFIAFVNGVCVGIISIVEAPKSMGIPDLSSNLSGKDVGKYLVNEVKKIAKQTNRPILISVDKNATSFWIKQGFRYVDDPEIQNPAYPIYVYEP